MTRLYLATCEHQAMRATFASWDWDLNPVKFLASFAAIEQWNKVKEVLHPVSTILDSGAYSAHTQGRQIDFDGLCTEAKNDWTEVAALDVIGDAHSSFDNAVRMKNLGLHVFPTFHYGEPWEYLQEYKKLFERVGLGGVATREVGFPKKLKWLEQCFARAYPCKFHGFGINRESLMMSLPFYSVDTTTWFARLRFNFQTASTVAYPDVNYPRYSQAGIEAWNFGADVLFQLERERRVQDRWASELSWTREAQVN